MYNVEELIAMAAEKRASDVHLIAGLPPKCRIDGEIVNLADVPLSKEDCDTYGLELAGEHIKKIDSIGQLDFAATLAVSMVSGVRISPMRITSGSSRREAYSPCS